MRGVALDLDGTAMLDRGQQGAGVRAIVRTSAAHVPGGQKGVGHGALKKDSLAWGKDSVPLWPIPTLGRAPRLSPMCTGVLASQTKSR